MSHSDDGRDEADDHDLGSDDDGDEGEAVREQDRYLPIANIARIMKRSLPPNAKIAKDAKETVQECVSEFISFITSEGELCLRCRFKNVHPPEPVRRQGAWRLAAVVMPCHATPDFTPHPGCAPLLMPFHPCYCWWRGTPASEKCQQEKRKTINGEDLLWAMSTLGFEKYVEPLKIYLHKFKEVRRQPPVHSPMG